MTKRFQSLKTKPAEQSSKAEEADALGKDSN